MEEIIKKYLSVGDGSGDGDVYGDVYGSGYGDVYGDGIEKINGQKVYPIDNTPTLIDSVHGNYARGSILNSDLTLSPCYIAKCGDYFAHGETLKEAVEDATEKYAKNQPVEGRIRVFNEKYPDRNKKVPAMELFNWHHILTGSCLMGRKNFCKNRGIDYENEEYTVNEFIALTENAYGGDVIKQLKDK